MTEQFKDVAMDFTLQDWEQLGLDQGNMFWDTALDNYQNLFLLNTPRSNLTSHPDGGEELEALVRGSPEVTGPDMAQAKNSPLLQDFLGEGLPQEIMETFSKDGLWNSNLGEAYMGESWLDSLVGDPESFLRSDIVTNMASSTEYKSHERKSGLSPQSLTGEDSVIHDLPEESLMPNKSQECRNDFGSHSDQSQQDIVQGGEKPYKCSECEKHFSRSCHLIQHWIIHMSENPTGNWVGFPRRVRSPRVIPTITAPMHPQPVPCIPLRLRRLLDKLHFPDPCGISAPLDDRPWIPDT